jgi:hypothetical protein
MLKIASLLIIGVVFLSGLGVGVATGDIPTKEALQSSTPNQVFNKGGFEIEAKYSAIRSYPGGGGIFILNMTPEHDFSGFVFLGIRGDSKLNAQLTARILHRNVRVAELTISPSEFIDIKTYEIVLTAIHFKMPILSTILYLISTILSPRQDYSSFSCFSYLDTHGLVYSSLFDIRRLVLEVELFNWSSGNLPDAIVKRDELIDWVETEHPEYGIFSDKESFAYVTYPGILIVEHWTFLYEEWEMRICYHVMIPPHDWSQIWLRRRGEIDPEFAAMRESDGTIYEISVVDYPTMFGY